MEEITEEEFRALNGTPEEKPPIDDRDPEVIAWEKIIQKFNHKTDLLIIPEEDNAFVERILVSNPIMQAIDDAGETGTLITLKGLPRPAIVRTGHTPLF